MSRTGREIDFADGIGTPVPGDPPHSLQQQGLRSNRSRRRSILTVSCILSRKERSRIHPHRQPFTGRCAVRKTAFPAYCSNP